MGRKKKTQAHFDSVEHFPKLLQDTNGNNHKETYVRITRSMMISKAWHMLTYRQRALYSEIKLDQTYQRERPYQEEPNSKFRQDDFYVVQKYFFEVYGSCKNNPRSFTNDIRALVKIGFLEIIRPGTYGGNHGIKNRTVCRFSEEWKKHG